MLKFVKVNNLSCHRIQEKCFTLQYKADIVKPGCELWCFSLAEYIDFYGKPVVYGQCYPLP